MSAKHACWNLSVNHTVPCHAMPCSMPLCIQVTERKELVAKTNVRLEGKYKEVSTPSSGFILPSSSGLAWNPDPDEKQYPSPCTGSS